VKIIWSYRSIPELASLSKEERKSLWREARGDTAFIKSTFYPTVIAFFCAPLGFLPLSMIVKGTSLHGTMPGSIAGGVFIGLLLGCVIGQIRLWAFSTWIRNRDIIQKERQGMTGNTATRQN